MTSVLNHIFAAIPLLITVICVALILTWSHWALLARHSSMGNGQKFPRQLAMLGLTIAGVVAIAISLPVSDSTRNQIIGLVGVLVSGVLAFSSTSVLSNLMAGIVLRMTQSFHTGDFMRVGDYFGRVAERGIFDVEIQTEQRELVSLSNSFLTAHPITVIRSSGAIVSATLSLGYDVHHAKVEPLLVKAAANVGLEEPFTQILELGNFSITYRVSGLLLEVGTLLTARSNLYRQILDVLHGAGVEILSPSFIAQRPVAPGQSILPKAVARSARPGKSPKAEDIVFDKAEDAEQRAKLRQELMCHVDELKSQIEAAESDVRPGLTTELHRLKALLADLELESTSG